MQGMKSDGSQKDDGEWRERKRRENSTQIIKTRKEKFGPVAWCLFSQ